MQIKFLYSRFKLHKYKKKIKYVLEKKKIFLKNKYEWKLFFEINFICIN
jgi:hypothetical protein